MALNFVCGCDFGHNDNKQKAMYRYREGNNHEIGDISNINKRVLEKCQSIGIFFLSRGTSSRFLYDGDEQWSTPFDSSSVCLNRYIGGLPRGLKSSS